MIRRWLAVAFVLAVVGACSAFDTGTPRPTPSRPLGLGERWLPVAVWEVDGRPVLCAGTGLVGGFFLHGSPVDVRSAWMTIPDGSREELAWPVGYSARFMPGLEVLDESGRVIAREGSTIDGGCETPVRGIWSVTFPSAPPP